MVHVYNTGLSHTGQCSLFLFWNMANHRPYRRRVVWAPLRLHRAACRCTVPGQGQVSVCPGLHTLSPGMWGASSRTLAQIHHPPHRPYGGHYTMISLKSKMTEKWKLKLQIKIERNISVAQTLGSALGLIRRSQAHWLHFQSSQHFHYHYRQPVWFKKRAIESIKPHQTHWVEELSNESAIICGKQLSAYSDKWLCSSQW